MNVRATKAQFTEIRQMPPEETGDLRRGQTLLRRSDALMAAGVFLRHVQSLFSVQTSVREYGRECRHLSVCLKREKYKNKWARGDFFVANSGKKFDQDGT